MSNARFWFVPLKDVVPAEQQTQLAAKDEVHARDLPASFNVPSKLYQEGIRAGHMLALLHGDTVTALARVLALDRAGTLHWLRLPMLQALELSATPELREVTDTEAQQFKLGIDAVLRDVPTSTGPTASPSARAMTYTPTGHASNTILYGPPGTGKTHCVRRRALELIGAANATTAPLSEVNAEWDQLRRAGQVVFCTFHQAFAYEEFIEGLRAKTEDGEVHYEVGDGVFKRLALIAAEEGLPRLLGDDFSSRWAALIAAIQNNPTYTATGANGGTFHLQVNARGNITTTQGTLSNKSFTTTSTSLTASREKMRLVWEDREKLGRSPTTPQLGAYNSIATPLWIVYRALHAVTASDAREAADSESPEERARDALAIHHQFTFASNAKQYVLVIDEINRANMARVFGELITLLEPDKRLGNSNELRVQLPASKEWFGVPPNLHVVGTMNTADRSIALMDVALRRRFTFEEMMPDAGALKDALAEAGVEESLRALVVGVFTKLNERLRFLYDREHQIGHAYFFEIESLDNLRDVFATKVIPLLQEYFFGHWDKVALALGHPHEKGAPKERGESDATILTVRKLTEKQVLGFNHDDYEDHQLDWGVHPAFRPRRQPPDTWGPDALEKLFREVSEDQVP